MGPALSRGMTVLCGHLAILKVAPGIGMGPAPSRGMTGELGGAHLAGGPHLITPDPPDQT